MIGDRLEIVISMRWIPVYPKQCVVYPPCAHQEIVACLDATLNDQLGSSRHIVLSETRCEADYVLEGSNNALHALKSRSARSSWDSKGCRRSISKGNQIATAYPGDADEVKNRTCIRNAAQKHINWRREQMAEIKP
nr:hypothetical protein Iba_chr05bCG5030 [Ipomoea batatas]